MNAPDEPLAATNNILIVDDSEVFRLMVGRDLLKSGFEVKAPSLFTNGSSVVYIVSDYPSALDLLQSGSAAHVDFSAIFLDWHLTPEDRQSGNDGIGLALLACDPCHQPLNSRIYCISAEGREMRERIVEKSPASAERIEMVDFLEVASKILDVAGFSR